MIIAKRDFEISKTIKSNQKVDNFNNRILKKE